MLSGYVKRVKSALKRSFEVEETDTSTHPSPLSRRTTNPLRSSTSSTSSQRSYDLSSRNSDYSSSRSSPSESSNPRSPKTGMRRIELSGGRNPDIASSRRTEISIEVSSKQIDNSPSAGIARFGLKRPEVSLSSRSTPPGQLLQLHLQLHKQAGRAQHDTVP
ncbi:neuronal-specific septin-3-like isoform X2 [Lates japonicus]